MWFQLLRYPADDPQAQVFWRRRMSVLAVAAVLVLLLAVLVTRGGGSSADAVTPAAAEQPAVVPSAPATDTNGLPPSPAAPSGSAAPSATPTASASPADRASTCAPGSMALRVSSDASSYPDGKEPMLTLSVVDIGSSPCVVDLGTTATSLTVLSSGKAVWSSAECVDAVARPVHLTPASAQVLEVRWDRTQNAGACESPKALPAGQYEVVGAVGDAVAYGGTVELQ